MRTFIGEGQKVLSSVICNCCGKALPVRHGAAEADFVHLQKSWGYFSDKDGVKQSFDLCEPCFDKWIQTFAVPVSEEEETELL